MTTPYGPVCDYCRTALLKPSFGTFFFPEQRFCTLRCLEAMDALRRQKARSKNFDVQRGWIDCAGKTRTWKITDGNGQHIAEVTTKRDALRLTGLLAGTH